jgi:hypothetical protein
MNQYAGEKFLTGHGLASYRASIARSAALRGQVRSLPIPEDPSTSGIPELLPPLCYGKLAVTQGVVHDDHRIFIQDVKDRGDGTKANSKAPDWAIYEHQSRSAVRGYPTKLKVGQVVAFTGTIPPYLASNGRMNESNDIIKSGPSEKSLCLF